ncbi:MAG: 23S rRNA (uracil(1939)-C(5))-methyltransferase RlmD [Woeseiaceae bacterium]
MSRNKKARKKREPETARIDSVTHDGKGIAAVAGKKVFVPGALEGETVVLQRRKRRKNYDEAQLLEVLERSDARIEPRCAAFGVCGGCTLQHLSASDQRSIKERALRDNLQRIGQVEPGRWLDPLFAGGESGGWSYRRRARLAVKDVAAKGRVLVGFREAHAPYVCDMHRCEVLSAPVGELIDPLSDLVGRLSIRARLPQIEVAVADNVTELVFRVLDPPSAADRVAFSEFAAAHAVQISLQTGGPGTVSPLEQSARTEELCYSLPEFDLEIAFEPTDFVQVNGAVNRLMVSTAIDHLDVSSEHRVLDLYCGIGNFSLALARKAAFVLAIEGEQLQVERGRYNADRNSIDNCDFRKADLAKIEGTESWLTQAWDRVLLDPARSGAQEIVANMSTIGASRVVYISCHPGTLARDAGVLVEEQGYELEAAGIIDMFPHTGHVESIAVFEKVA